MGFEHVNRDFYVSRFTVNPELLADALGHHKPPGLVNLNCGRSCHILLLVYTNLIPPGATQRCY